jgi:large subunit ribosomal protein L15e
MGMYKQMKQSFESEYKQRSDIYKERVVRWNAEPSVSRIEKPTNIARARELGYKAKPGVVVVRVKIVKGKRKKDNWGGGRKPSKSGRFFSMQKSLQSIAEERASRKFANTEVLNSYFIGGTGQSKFFEVILLDRANPSILNDRSYSTIVGQRGRAFRALTASGRTHRGVSKNKGVAQRG